MAVTIQTNQDFEREVRKRDNHQCRWCETSLEAGRILSIYGNNPLRLHDVRTAILLCAQCYGVIQRGDWCVRGLSHFEGTDGRQYLDATYRICFEPTGL